MKKFAFVISVVICCVCVFCSCGTQSEDDPTGNSWARLTGIKLSVNDETESPLTTVDDVYVLIESKSYILEILLLRTGGSAPSYIPKSEMQFSYAEDVIKLEDCNPDDIIDYNYEIRCIKTDIITSIKVTAFGFNDEIKVKFIN